MQQHTFVLSDESVNVHGFRLLSSGGRLNRFLENPVMLSDHINKNASVLGKWVNLRVEDNQLLAEAEFDIQDQETSKIADKVKRGYIKAASVGIVDLAHGIGPDSIPVVYDWELVEASIVPVPSNANALRLYSRSYDLLEGADLQLALQSILNINTINHKIITMNINETARVALGLKESYTEHELNAAITQLSLDNTRLQKMQQDERRLRAEQTVDEAIKQRKITAAKREVFLKLALQDLDAMTEALTALPTQHKPMDYVQLSSKSADDRSTWTKDDWRKRDPKRFLELKSTDPEQYQVIWNK